MITFDSEAARYLFTGGAIVGAVALLFVGYKIGRWLGDLSTSKTIAGKEQELFTAQKGFKSLYEQELGTLKTENATLAEKVKNAEAKVEEYRKKAAGFGGLFNSGGKRADAMYALLLENEALEEALHKQNEKMHVERTDAVAESLRNTGYRRVLLSQLMNDDRIKDVVAEIMSSDRHLPAPGEGREP